jgi:hypothetical protein
VESARGFKIPRGPAKPFWNKRVAALQEHQHTVFW